MTKIKYLLAIIGTAAVLLLGTTALASDNLALGKTVTCSAQQSGNEASHIADGSLNTRWSAEGYPEYVIIDLGQDYNLGYTLMYPSTEQGRSYQYQISVAASENPDEYTPVFDEDADTENASLMFDDMNGICGRYVKLEITGGTATWISIYEFEIYGIDAEVNWALGGSISEYSAQQNDSEVHLAEDIIDGNTNTRWSAEGYPNYVVVDLGEPRAVSRAEIEPLESRAYQYKIEASLDGNNYFLLAENEDNTAQTSIIYEEFSQVSARFVKLTVTGSGTNNTWISINEFRVFGTYFNEARPVTDVSISLSENTVNMTGTSSALYGGTVTLVAVVFDGGQMTEIKMKDIDFNGFNTDVSGSITLYGDLNGKTVEAFVWDNDASMASCSDTFSL